MLSAFEQNNPETKLKPETNKTRKLFELNFYILSSIQSTIHTNPLLWKKRENCLYGCMDGKKTENSGKTIIVFQLDGL
jgi:hypothetical protein